MKYNTKRRRKERAMILVAITTFLIAVGLILVVKQATATEIELRLQSISVTIPREVEDTRTIKEHVWDLMTIEGGLTFDEAMTGMQIITLESRWDEYAIGINKGGSKDLGLWQINDKFHDIGRACSFDTYCSTRYAIKLYKDWGNWTAWVTYNNFIK